MDKSWIKGVLIAAFVITLGYVYVVSYRTLEDSPATPIKIPPPTPPMFTRKPTLPANATSQQLQDYLTAAKNANDIDKVAVDAYVNQVAAYKDDVTAQITAAKANMHDRSNRLDAYEKVVKDTLASLILTPLLGGLLIYSGIKIGGDVAATRVVGARTEVKAP